ncbi:MAG TPA: NAD-dependent deacylase [Candidatus Hydrogenedentes bacterium]|nr:NAD-dependent deacylase [Candidatus Hydrogenedentota bacterium]
MPNLSFLDCQRIVFFTGAGLSAESGIPTYRGRGGIWTQYNYEDFACQRAFDRDPEKVWDFHDVRRERVAACEPNAGHRIIAAVQRARPDTVVITQNIDGLHQRAGATNVIELHGSLWRVRCDRDGLVVPNDQLPINPRHCACGAYWRPDIVWFEDNLDPDVLERAGEALARCDAIVSIGTSGIVYPAAELPRIAVRNGALSVEINLEDTPVSHLYQHHLRTTASEALGELFPNS